jgi:two-component system chemotaxis sensor kinase CheA
MNEFVQTLWQEFAVESDEHLSALEPLLVRVGSGEAEMGDVARLFRGFHSLKGMARAMGLYGMEAVAHRSESLLGLVRDGGVAMTEPMLDALLEAVDCLRGLRDTAAETHADSAAPPGLLHKLDALFAAAGGLEAKPVEASPPDTGAAELSEDAEMLQLFVELMQTRLPELARMFDADEARRADLVDTLETLENAASVMQFDNVAETLSDLNGFLVSQALPLDAAARRQAAEKLADIILQARLMSEVAGGDAGAEALSQALAGALAGDLARALVGVVTALGSLENAARSGGSTDGSAGGRQEAGAAAAFARVAQAILQCLALARMADLLLLIEDICARIAAGQQGATGLLASVMQSATEAAAQAAESGRDLGEEQAGDLARRIRGALQADKLPDEAGEAAVILAQLRDHPEMLEALSADNIRDLVAGVATGDHVYELMLYLEEAQAVGEAIVVWLTAEAKVVSNRTVLTNGESWFEFLVLSRHAPDAFRDALLQLDPERQCVKWLRQLGGHMLLDGVEAGDEAEAAGAIQPNGPPNGPVAQQRSSTVLRVRGDVIDRFMTQIGEIRTAAAELAQLTGSRGPNGTRPQHERTVGELARTVETDLRRLQAAALELRVVPIDTILNRFPRVVRALAHEQGKNVRLTLEGRDVRVDKSMVDLLVDPLMHMVRNSVDHGIEPPDERARAGKPAQASVTLSAAQRGSEVQVRIADDGRGLNKAAILDKAVAIGLASAAEAARLRPHEIHRFIFEPGFSTAAKVSETSGRGVGMDVVLTAVQQLGGNIDVESTEGNGTTFTLRMPLSAAMQAALLVDVDGQTFGVAERFVSSVLEVPAEEMLESGGQAMIRHDAAALPVYRLRDLLWHDAAAAPPAAFRSVVIVSNGRETIGVEVDQVEGRQELFLKELHPLVAACPTVGGAAVLGDGRIILLLDVDELIQLVRGGAWRGAPAAVGEDGA